MSTRLLDPAGAVEWLPVSPESEPSRSDLTLGKVVMLRADSMVVGLYVENGLQAGEPLRITRIEPCGDRLVFTFHDGLRMSYNPDDRVPMQCLTRPCPAWCRGHDVDSDGTVRHCGADEAATFTDPAGRSYTILATATRYDDPDGTIESGPMVTVSVLGASGIGSSGIDFEMGPEPARELAAMMTRVAASVDDGPHLVYVTDIRLDDEVMTAAGWQTVTLVVHDGRRREAVIYTVSDEDAALRVPLGTLVQIRRGGA